MICERRKDCVAITGGGGGAKTKVFGYHGNLLLEGLCLLGHGQRRDASPHRHILGNQGPDIAVRRIKGRKR